ncbi:hypothetical protein K491DRAFT_757547 [Lophiostoma macrostomum CBS 122681]|uniref:Fe2OG dioxygenase domain-containing protein n=1 Tax=Lophiostoma macrostomum CBS 122681 TaxID=1314788 RepID=A0A6A6T8X5_9PLEO|nr:hypothetical protein K491DRAFT_757547 [Lophiostoma macrostomum CBS 122681]
MAESKRKRDSVMSPGSLLSDYPDDLSDCSLGRAEKRSRSRLPTPVPSPLAFVSLIEGEQEVPYIAQPGPLELPSWPDEKLVALSKKLTFLPSAGASKPPPSGRPEIWADGRQELCETLHYYRAYHSGGYTNNGHAWAFMFDKTAHTRDFIDSDVVISRAGGGMVPGKEAGEMTLGSDQNETSQALSLRNSMEYLNPVPTYIWSEKTGEEAKTVVRYRFEKFGNKQSWWKPMGVADPVALGGLPPPAIQVCRSCNGPSQQVYLQGWMCLHSSCPLFWKLPSGLEPIEGSLLYDPRFLKQKTTWPNDDQDFTLVPPAIEVSPQALAGEDCSRAFWNGIVCPTCGRCIMRLAWRGWICSCGFTKVSPHTLVPAKSLSEPFFPLSNAYTPARDCHQSAIKLDVFFMYNYRVHVYTFPGIAGFVAHLIANKTIVEGPGGPNDMFEELQTVDIGFERRELDSGMTKGGSSTRHFSVNYGMPYKYVATTSSRPFTGSANAIKNTRSRLNWVAKTLLRQQQGEKGREGSGWKEFNEVLALGYFEGQKIKYHDDGEVGLGPTIATLSLGAPGRMRIRMKGKYFNGVSRGDTYNDKPPVPLCKAYHERMRLVNELAVLKATDTKAYKARLKKIPKELGLNRGTAKDALDLTLGHGDIVIMDGEDLQKFYEHAVEHAGKLRFALTCRHIALESLKEKDKPTYEVEPDEGFYDGSLVGTAAATSERSAGMGMSQTGAVDTRTDSGAYTTDTLDTGITFNGTRPTAAETSFFETEDSGTSMAMNHTESAYLTQNAINTQSAALQASELEGTRTTTNSSSAQKLIDEVIDNGKYTEAEKEFLRRLWGQA